MSNTRQFEMATRLQSLLHTKSRIWDQGSNSAIGKNPVEFSETFSYHQVAKAHLKARHRGDQAHLETLVIFQDVGLMTRALVAAFRARGSRIALVPDGIVFSNQLDLRPRFHFVKEVLDRLGTHLGFLVGESGRWGATKPDLVCSWGEGWSSIWATGSNVEVTGAVMLDHLASIPQPSAGERILICSQPLARLGFDAEMTAHWYRILDHLIRTDDRVKVRLHPSELESSGSYAVPPSLVPPGERPTLESELEWATIVAAPLSTTLLDAAVAGRRPVRIRIGSKSDRFQSPALNTPELAVIQFDPTTPPESLVAHIVTGASQSDSPAIAERYAFGVGGATEAVASALDRLAASAALGRSQSS